VILARALATSVCTATVFLCRSSGEFFSPILDTDPVHIVGGYSIGRSLGCGLELLESAYSPQNSSGPLGYRTVIEPSVVRIGWDEEFIMVEQHFLPHCLGDRPNGDPRWHIIVVSTGKHYSWRTYDDFVSLRDRVLHVPDTIEMRDADEVYSQG